MTINLIQPETPGAKVASVWQRSSRFITCMFCGLRGRQIGDSPLCSSCLIDPVQTKTAIYLQLHGVERQEAAAADAWLALATEHADAWDKVRAAQRLPDFDARAAQHRAAQNVYGRLLDAHDAYEQALAPLSAERARLEAALEVLEAL